MKHVAHVLKGTACNIFIFLVLFALQACMFIVQVGPLTIPDPDMHPLSTYALATGQSLNPVAKGKDAHGNTVKQQSIEGDSRLLTIPGFANVLIVESISRATQGDSSRETQQSADDVMADHIVVPDGTHTNRSNAYFPLDYLPQAIGLKIAMLVNLPPYAQWQAARISNSILYAIMGCFAIALLPRWESLMALLLVIPPVAFVASSLMIDGMIVALSACMVAAIAAVAEGKRLISLPHTVVLGVLAWALACEKLPYAFVAVAVLFLPSAVMTVRRKLEFVGIAAVLTGALYLPWSVLFGSSLAQVDVSHNVSVALSHPILTIGKIVHSMLFLGTFAYLPTWYVATAAVLGLVWLVAVAYTVKQHWTGQVTLASWAGRHRFLVLGLVIAAAEIAAFVLFVGLTWNDLASMSRFEVFEGIQGRYALPILPVFLLGLVVVDNRNGRQPALAH